MSDKASTPEKDQAAEQPAAGQQSPAKEPASVKANVSKAHVSSSWKYDRPLTACRFDPLGRYVFAGVENYTVQRFDLKDGKLTPFVGHESWCRAIGFSHDGQTTFTGGYDGRLLWWQTDAAEPKPLRAVAAHDGWIRALAVSPDGKLIATCGNDNLVKLWNSDDGSPVHTLSGHESHVYNVAFHPDGKDLVSCDQRINFKHWSLADGKEARTLRVEAMHKFDERVRAHIGGARSMAFSADGKLFAAGGVTNVTNALGGLLECAVASVEWDSFKLKVLHLTKEKNRGTIWGLAWHKDGYWIGMSGGRNALLVTWNPDKAEESAKFAMNEIGRDFDLHPDGLQVAVALAENQLNICQLTAKPS